MSQLNVVLSPKSERAAHPAMEATPVVVDLTRRVFNVKTSTALPGGFMQATLSVLMRRNEAYEWYERHHFKGIGIYEAEQPVWEGRITEIALRDYGIDLTCEGYWASLADVKLYSFWADNDMSKWQTPQGWHEGGGIDDAITLLHTNDKFLIDTQEHLFIFGTKQNVTYYSGNKGVIYYRLPRFDLLAYDSIFQPQTIHSMMYSFDMPGGTPWSVSLDLVVYTAPNPQGSWTKRDAIPGTGLIDSARQSGTRVFPLVVDDTESRAVALGLELTGTHPETSADWVNRILLTNVTLFADNWPLTARRSTNKKIITDLLAGNTNIDVTAKARQISTSSHLIDESDADFVPLVFEGETIQEITAKLGEVGIAESKGFQFKQGVYTGDGTSGRAIAGIGFQPKVVMIKGNTASNASAATRWAGFSVGVAVITGGADTHIDSLDADGFTVSYDAGDTAGVNTNGVVYYWYCFGGTKVEVSTYIGNGADDHLIDLGFPEKPDMVWILPSSTSAVRWAIAGGNVDFTMPFGGAVSHYTNEIKELLPGQFKLGDDSDVNTDTTEYYYVAFAPTPALITGRYKGNGADDREVPDLPIHFLANLLNVKHVSAGADWCVWCTTELDDVGDATFGYYTGASLANYIQDLTPSGELGRWQVGTHSAVNSSGEWYYFFACAEGNYPDAHNIEFIPANVGVFGRRKLQVKKRDRANIRWVVPVRELGEAGLELERTISQFWSWVWASYQEPVTGFEGWTEPARHLLASELWHDERYTTFDSGNVPETTAEMLRDVYAADVAKPAQRASLTLTGLITNPTGAREPLWRVRAGDLIFLQDLTPLPQLRPDSATGILDALRVFTIKETEYDTSSNELSIVLDYAPLAMEMLLARLEMTPAPFALASPMTVGSLFNNLAGWG